MNITLTRGWHPESEPLTQSFTNGRTDMTRTFSGSFFAYIALLENWYRFFFYGNF